MKFKGIRGKNPDSINVNGALTLVDGTKLWVGQAPGQLSKEITVAVFGLTEPPSVFLILTFRPL